MELHNWQSECLDLWAKNRYRGIVNAVTGSGKTFLALEAAKRLEAAAGRKLRVKIVVPKDFLASQWKKEIRRRPGVKASDIGMFSGKHKDNHRKYMIYVVNSARYNLARHILADFKNGYAVLLIADECHRYGSDENNRIFDFYAVMGKNAPYYSLGLSATPEIVDFRAISVPLGREIYSYSLGSALKDRIISRFILFSIGLTFKSDEFFEYEELSRELSNNLGKLYSKHPELHGISHGRFFAALQKLIKHEDETAQLAKNALNTMYARRSLCHMAADRPACALLIVKSLPTDARIILFCERINAAESLYASFEEIYPNQTGLYHSKMSDSRRRDMLDSYSRGILRLLVCCKALDEGLNIPSTDAGIIVSTTMSARQHVQRLGRMLRLSDDIKRIYFLFIKESSEDRELLAKLTAPEDNVPLIEFSYFGGIFASGETEELRINVLSFVKNRRNSPQLLNALDQYMDRAFIRGDYLLAEPVCRENIKNSQSSCAGNYWKAVLYLVLAKEGRLGEV